MVVADSEVREIREAAAREKMTVSEWVRQALRRARRDAPTGDAARKLATARAAVRHSFPVGDVDEMLAEIELGYGGGPP